MKKMLAILILTAMLLPSFAFPAAAADTVSNYNSFNGTITSMPDYTPGNITVDYITAASGVYNRVADDISIKMSPSSDRDIRTSNNPHIKISQEFKASNGEYVHVGLSFAAENTNFSSMGLGGKLYYNYTYGGETKSGNGFMNGTAIMAKNGKIYAFDNEISAFEPKKWYSVDIFVNSSTGRETVYLNGNLVLDDVPVSSTLQGVNYDSWVLTGFSDLRLNSIIDPGVTNDFYFDDLRYGLVRNINVNPGLTGSDGISVSGTIIDLRNGFYPDAASIEAKLNVPAGATLNIYYDQAAANIIFPDGTSYIYSIINNGVVRYNFNNQSGLFTGITYEGGLGAKAEDDYAVTANGVVDVSGLNVDISDGSRLTIEVNILTKGIPSSTAYIFEPWFEARDDDQTGGNAKVATNLIGFGPGGKIYVSGVAVANYEINRWYKVAVTFTGGSENIKVYINGKYIGEYVNVSGMKLLKMYRIKCSFPSGIPCYLDDLVWYKGDYDYSRTAVTLTSSTYTINDNSIVLDDNTVTVAVLKAGLSLDMGSYKIYTDSSYGIEALDTDTITEAMVLVIDSPDGTTKHYYGFIIRNPDVRNVSFVKAGVDSTNTYDIYELVATFEARESDVANGNKLYYKLIIAEYEGNSLKGIALKDVELSEDNLFTTEYVEYMVNIGTQPQLKAFVWNWVTLEPLATPVLEN